jgi:hypothetical protein
MVIGIMGCAGGAIVGAVSGGIYGAIAAEPENSVQTVMTSVREALTSSHLQERLQDQVRSFTKGRTGVPQASEEQAASVRLETVVLSIEFDGLHPSVSSSIGNINPSLQMFVSAEARLMKIDNRREIYTARFQYWGSRMTLAEWASNDAELVRKEIDRATVELAEQVVDGIFLLYRAP